VWFIVEEHVAAVVSESLALFVPFVEFCRFPAEEDGAAGFFEDEDDEEEEHGDDDGVDVEDPSEVVSPTYPPAI